jgi:hypothetical protein
MAFHDLLLHLNFNDEQSNAIIDEGLRSPEDLRTYTQQDIRGFFKHLSARNIHTPYGAQHNFQIMRYWVEKRTSMGLSIDEEDFTIEMLNQWGDQMKAASDDKNITSKPTILPPAAFKKETKWRTWKEQFSPI